MASANKLIFQVGQETFEPTGELLAQYVADCENAELLKQEKLASEANRKQKKQELLDKLGITEEEAAALLA